MGSILIGLADRDTGFSHVRGQLVKDAQSILIADGYMSPPANGIYDAVTAAAVRIWQRNTNAPVTGDLTYDQYRQLTSKTAGEFEVLSQLTASFDGPTVAPPRQLLENTARPQAAKLGLTGPLGVALCFDIAVQMGRIAAPDITLIEEQFAAACGTIGQRRRREIVASVLAEHSGSDDLLRERLLTIAKGFGRVKGVQYNLRDWGISQPPEAAPAIAVTSAQDRFDAFFSALDLKFFTPDEFRYLGASHSNPDKVGKGFGLNYLPHESLWANMMPTARILERLRRDLQASIRLTNVYRSPAYNSAIGGAPNSQHMQFNAVDFFCNNGQSPEHWGATLKTYRAAGDFSGGIGIYTAKNFVHIDTRGENVDFTP
ncbi:MAG: D-Ala-D-Ala carboxypeptidase family metallohydrolase [Rhodobacter sp.]|nr:D-Ala-D-Ala carboxypeptidase family metallohydrolase [Rhodobacter sp.]